MTPRTANIAAAYGLVAGSPVLLVNPNLDAYVYGKYVGEIPDNSDHDQHIVVKVVEQYNGNEMREKASKEGDRAAAALYGTFKDSRNIAIPADGFTALVAHEAAAKHARALKRSTDKISNALEAFTKLLEKGEEL